MNLVVLMGRLTRDPEIRYTQGPEPLAIARYTLAVDRRKGQGQEASADFINCVAFGPKAEFTEKYFHKGTKIAIKGHIQTGSYTDKNGNKVYTTDIVIDEHEFAESKGTGNTPAAGPSEYQDAGDGFMNIPDGIDEEMPFA